MVDRPSRQAPSGQVGFGVLLRSLRERALVSQEELAARAGVSVRAIGNLEQGRVARPRGGSVRLLADALGLVGAERQRFEEAARQRVGDAGRPLPEGPQGCRRWPARPGSEDGLAVHVAHQLRDRFPDGQLYVNLRGAQQRPLPAMLVLGRIVGPERVAAEPDAATRIVGFCGRLPLAIRVVGARLAARPGWPLARLAELLADARRRLDQLAAGDLEVRASLALSYQALSLEQQRALRLLGLLDLAAVDPTGASRYRFHDLVRLYARERSAAEDHQEERRVAVAGVTAGWLALAEQADARLPVTANVVSFGARPAGCSLARWSSGCWPTPWPGRQPPRRSRHPLGPRRPPGRGRPLHGQPHPG